MDTCDQVKKESTSIFKIIIISSLSDLILICYLQIRKRLMVSDKGQLEWKKMYFKLCRCYPHKEQYSDTLQFCTHCHILFWKVRLKYVYTASNNGFQFWVELKSFTTTTQCLNFANRDSWALI